MDRFGPVSLSRGGPCDLLVPKNTGAQHQLTAPLCTPSVTSLLFQQALGEGGYMNPVGSPGVDQIHLVKSQL